MLMQILQMAPSAKPRISRQLALPPSAGSCAVESMQITCVEGVASGPNDGNNAREWRAVSVLGTYSIWHDRLRQSLGTVKVAEYGLLQDLGLVPLGDCRNVHSVLIQPSVDFTIYLPPSKIRQLSAG